MWSIGIDCGQTGAIVAINSGAPSKPCFHEMPVRKLGLKTGKFRERIDRRQVREILKGYCTDFEAHIVMEKLHGFTFAAQACQPAGQWNFAADYGAMESILEEFGEWLQVPHTLFLPVEWQKLVHKTGDKSGSIVRALELFPQCLKDLEIPKKGRYQNYHDGKAEALLLAYIGLTHTRTLSAPTQKRRIQN